MFDEIIYKVLDRIQSTCECLKKCIKDKSLPKACYDEKTKQEEVKKWSKDRENDYK